MIIIIIIIYYIIIITQGVDTEELPDALTHQVIDLRDLNPDCVPDCPVTRKKQHLEQVGASEGVGIGQRRHSDYCDVFRLHQYVSHFTTQLKAKTQGMVDNKLLGERIWK